LGTRTIRVSIVPSNISTKKNEKVPKNIIFKTWKMNFEK